MFELHNVHFAYTHVRDEQMMCEHYEFEVTWT